MIIDGYVIRSTTDLGRIYEELNTVKKKIDIISEKEYYKLLGKEAAFLADKVVLGKLKDDIPVMAAAVNNVNQRIQKAGLRGDMNAYNLKAYVHILIDGNDTYLNVMCANKKLLKAFSPYECVSVSEIECMDDGNAKNILWRKLHAKFDNHVTISCDLSCNVLKTIETLDRTKVKYPDVKERKRTEAIEEVFNSQLSMISQGENINPIRLYSYIGDVFDYIASDDGQTRIRQNEQKLHMLLDLNKDDSTLWGEKEVPSHDPDSN